MAVDLKTLLEEIDKSNELTLAGAHIVRKQVLASSSMYV